VAGNGQVSSISGCAIACTGTNRILPRLPLTRVHHALTAPHVLDPEPGQLLAAHAVIEQGNQDGVIARALERVVRRRPQQLASLALCLGTASAGGTLPADSFSPRSPSGRPVRRKPANEPDSGPAPPYAGYGCVRGAIRFSPPAQARRRVTGGMGRGLSLQNLSPGGSGLALTGLSDSGRGLQRPEDRPACQRGVCARRALFLGRLPAFQEAIPRSGIRPKRDSPMVQLYMLVNYSGSYVKGGSKERSWPSGRTPFCADP
jgi:hypothetical protein